VVILRLNSSSLKHKGIKAELHGVIQKHGTITTTMSEFLNTKQDLSPPDEIFKEQTSYEFNFPYPFLKHESYKGNYASVKYFIKIIIETSILSTTFEKEFAVVNPHKESILYKHDFPIRLKVGVKNVLSLGIEFEHSNYNCRGTLKGAVSFNLVNTKIKSMEAQLVRREIIFDGKKYEPEYIANFELVDGSPCNKEKLPIRFFLKSYNITPSYPDVEEMFGVKYFINFVVVDGDDNRYFKYTEIKLFRLFVDKEKLLSDYDNHGLFISFPFFEDEYIYGVDTFKNKNNQRKDRNNKNKRRNEDEYYEDDNNNYVGDDNYNNNGDNNLVLNVPGENNSNQDFNDDDNDFRYGNNNRNNYNERNNFNDENDNDYNNENIQYNDNGNNRNENDNNYDDYNEQDFNDRNYNNFNNEQYMITMTILMIIIIMKII
jgi:vacuolar protein sorting-associated protein 26